MAVGSGLVFEIHAWGVFMSAFRYLSVFLVSAALLSLNTCASACSLNPWTSAVGLSNSDTGEPSTGFSRYSGRCSLRVNGPNKFVQDNSPVNATSYFVRFYVNTGTIANAEIFKALDASNATVIRVSYNAGAFSFFVKGAPAQPADIPATAGRWYSVELEWSQGAAAQFKVKVQGDGGAAVIAPVTSINSATDTINHVQFGMINAGATGQGFFDGFASRRNAAPGRLCKGDANGNGMIQGSDRVAISNEIAGTVATGRPDCNENGAVQGADRVCVSNLILAGTTCGP